MLQQIRELPQTLQLRQHIEGLQRYADPALAVTAGEELVSELGSELGSLVKGCYEFLKASNFEPHQIYGRASENSLPSN